MKAHRFPDSRHPRFWYRGRWRTKAWLARAHGVPPQVLYKRLALGMPLEEALTRPWKARRTMAQAVWEYLVKEGRHA